MLPIPKNFGFKIILVETTSRKLAGCGTQFDLNKHIRQAKKDFAEFAEESKNGNRHIQN
jgi:hypothetical protein